MKPDEVVDVISIIGGADVEFVSLKNWHNVKLSTRDVPLNLITFCAPFALNKVIVAFIIPFVISTNGLTEVLLDELILQLYNHNLQSVQLGFIYIALSFE